MSRKSETEKGRQPDPPGGVRTAAPQEVITPRHVRIPKFKEKLELLYRYTLIGHAFLAIAEDNYAARALGLPERRLRMASFALAGVIGALAGFAGGEMLLAFFANAPMLTFYGFVPVALGGMGNNRGAVVAGLLLGLFQQTANFLVGGIFASVAVFTVFIIVLLARPEGLVGSALQRRV